MSQNMAVRRKVNTLTAIVRTQIRHTNKLVETVTVASICGVSVSQVKNNPNMVLHGKVLLPQRYLLSCFVCRSYITCYNWSMKYVQRGLTNCNEDVVLFSQSDANPDEMVTLHVQLFPRFYLQNCNWLITPYWEVIIDSVMGLRLVFLNTSPSLIECSQRLFIINNHILTFHRSLNKMTNIITQKMCCAFIGKVSVLFRFDVQRTELFVPIIEMFFITEFVPHKLLFKSLKYSELSKKK